jgi:hypothetical protein
MNILKKIFNGCALILLITFSGFGQDTLMRSATPIGGRWSSSGSIASFISVGQTAVATQLKNDTSGWSGSVGFITPVGEFRENHAPVALASKGAVLINTDDAIFLEGFDPDGDSISFQVIEQPSNGLVQKVSGSLSQYAFLPVSGLIPDQIYRDSLTFQVSEVEGKLKSSIVTYRFKFSLGDEPHIIDTAYFDKQSDQAGLMSVIWDDAVINDRYHIQLDYYDLTNVSNPVFRNLYSSTDLSSALDVTDGKVKFDFSIANADHPYIFAGAKVFITVLVTSDNGNADFTTFVIDNIGGGRTDGSADGLFFAFGSDMTVRENGAVQLNLIAVELGDFSLDNATLEILKIGTQGVINIPAVKETKTNTKTWQVTYQGTKEIGGLDSIQFRIYQPARQEFDTAWAKIQIKDVNDAPRITLLPDIQTNEEVPLTVALNYLDPDNEVVVFVESNEATSVPVSYSNGQITITPGVDYSGLVSVNVIITEIGTDEEYVAFDRFDVVVKAVNDAPVVALVSDKSINEDQSLALVLSATDSDAKLPIFDFSASVDQPSKVDFVIDGNNVTIIPKPNVNGSFVINLYADDRLGTATSRSTARTFTLVVNAVNDAPFITKQFKTQKLIAGLPAYQLDMKAYFNDVENGSNMQYTAGGNTDVVLTFAGSVMTVSTNGSFSGIEDVEISANDGELAISQQVSFVSAQQNANLQVANPVGSVQYDEDFGVATIDVSNVFADQNNANAVFTYDLIGGGFLNAVIDAETGLITVTSLKDYFGSEDFFLIGTTNEQSVYTDLSVQINAVNDIPVMEDLADQVMQEDLPLEGLFIATSDIDNTFSELSLTAVSDNDLLIQSNKVTISAATDGYYVSITPEPNKNGIANLTLTLSDGASTVSQQMTVNVQSINDQPEVLIASIPTVNEDVLFSLDVRTLFSDIENDVLKITLSEYPTWTNFSNNVLSGTPANDQVGSWTITANVDDGNGGNNTVTLALDVINTNDAPQLTTTIAAITVFQENNWSYGFPTSAFKDIDANDVLTYTFESYPSWATLNNLTLTGNPQYEDIGIYEMVLKGTDQVGLSVSQTVSVLVEFTVYDAMVTVSQSCDVAEGKLAITASGALNYKWYDSQQTVIQATGNVLNLDGPYDTSYFVEGVDSNGNATPNLLEITVECTVLSTEELRAKVSIFPNPTQEYLTINHFSSQLSFDVYDIMGKKIEVEILKNERGVTELNVSNLRDGIYLINYKVGDKNEILRFIKN